MCWGEHSKTGAGTQQRPALKRLLICGGMNFGTGGKTHSPLFFHKRDSLAGIASGGAFFNFSRFLSMVFASLFGFFLSPFFLFFFPPHNLRGSPILMFASIAFI